MVNGYPVSFDVDFPTRPLGRLSTAFRFIVAIPILALLTFLSGETFRDNDHSAGNSLVIGGAAVFVPLVLMLVFRQKYPRWWFDWNLQLQRFGTRVGAYVALMDDRYPSTDEDQSVHLDYVYPDVQQDLNRWLPLVKWLLAIPHYVVLFFLWIAAIVSVLVAWFAILFTGRYPRGLFTFVEGVIRWTQRVLGYAFLLVTDAYPPFQLS
jgi:hypothetical protein